MARWSEVRQRAVEARKREWPKFVRLDVDKHGNVIEARSGALGGEQDQLAVQEAERWWNATYIQYKGNPEDVNPLIVELLISEKAFTLVVHAEKLPK